MSTFSFKCPRCSNSMQLPVSLYGKQGKCPSCNSVVTIEAIVSNNPAQQPPQQQPPQQQLPQQQYPQQQYPQQQPLQQQPLQQQPLQQQQQPLQQQHPQQQSKKKPLTKNLMLVGIILIPFIAIALGVSFYVDKQNNERADRAYEQRIKAESDLRNMKQLLDNMNN